MLGSIVLEYRAYIVSDEDHFLGWTPLTCADDATAVAAAKRLVDGHDIELWQARRMVTGSQSGPQRGGINHPVTEETSHVADTKED
jgi:hypothetical protein